MSSTADMIASKGFLIKNLLHQIKLELLVSVSLRCSRTLVFLKVQQQTKIINIYQKSNTQILLSFRLRKR